MGHFCLKAESSTDSRSGRVSPGLLLSFVKFFCSGKEGSFYAFSEVCIITGAVNVLKSLGEAIAYER